MIDYSSWPEKLVKVTNLQLDPENPRIPTGGAKFGQRELIAELIEHDKVYELTKNIVDSGYYPLESLIGLTDNGKTYILEGNRRLAALKLLISPEFAPETAIQKFRALVANVPSGAYGQVRVLYAPSREAAAHVILQRHTREQISGWSPLMQARFFKSLLAGGLTPTELAAQYNVKPSEVAEFLRLDSAYEVACALDLPDDVRAAVRNPREFNASALQRAIEYPSVREFLGISFNESGRLQGRIDKDEFRKGYKRLLTDIAQKNLDTRTLNKAKDAETYLSKIAADAPDRNKRGKFTEDDLTKDSVTGKGPLAAPPKAYKTKPAIRLSSSLFPLGMKCRVVNSKIRTVFGEMRKLKVEQMPNTNAAMLRIILELSVGNYLDKTGKIKPLIEQAQKSGKPKDWYPPWKQLVNAMLQDNEIQVDALARKKLNKLVNDTNYSALDGFVHNRYETATPNELRDIAGALLDIFEVVFREPSPPSQATATSSK